MRFRSFLKKMMALVGGVLISGLLYISVTKADDLVWRAPQNTPLRSQDYSNNFLQTIARNTTMILNKLDLLPNYITLLIQYAVNVQKEDQPGSGSDYSFIKSNQASFATVGNQLVSDNNMQLTAQQQITADFFGVKVTNLMLPRENKESILYAVPQVNDISYATMLGMPPAPKGNGIQTASYNYIKYGAGYGAIHYPPSLLWSGSINDRLKYYYYFNTIVAIKSFGAYVLSNLAAEVANGSRLTPAQITLVGQATSADWFAHVATEEIGKVLRHILLFESQNYVLMTELLKTQKELLTAQVMTNTILIQNNMLAESELYRKAQGRNTPGT